jgi:hypothetical protein
MVDKYIIGFEEGELFKDEFFIIPPEQKIEWHGKDQEVLCNVFDSLKMEEDHKSFLDSVIGQVPSSTKLNLEESYYCALMEKISFLQLVNETSAKVLFFWNSAALIEGVSLEQFAPKQLGDKWLLALPSINEFQNSKAHKAALWKAMKYIFNIQ